MRGETVLVNGEPVENVLVEPGQARDATDAERPAGTTVDYTLRFPSGYEGAVSDAKVTVRGIELDTLTHADHLRPERVFGSWGVPWDMTVLVGRTPGDMAAAVRVLRLEATVDEMGDPVRSEVEVYAGPAQARRTGGVSGNGTEGGTASETDSTETWAFVVPWTDAIAGLRPQAAAVERGGARYRVTSIENVDDACEHACIRAVRHG